jgi:Salmonella virulence plasmid 65kDa B protein
VISWPSGGGAISGLGEKFSADLFTGLANVSVPIGVPAGRGGVQLQRLSFSTGNGNGRFGLGWGPEPARREPQDFAWGVPMPEEASARLQGDIPRAFPGLAPDGKSELGARRWRAATRGSDGLHVA